MELRGKGSGVQGFGVLKLTLNPKPKTLNRGPVALEMISERGATFSPTSKQ